MMGKGRGQEQKGMTEDEGLDGITDSMDMSLSKLREKLGCSGAVQRVRCN